MSVPERNFASTHPPRKKFLMRCGTEFCFKFFLASGGMGCVCGGKILKSTLKLIEYDMAAVRGSDGDVGEGV